MPGVKFADFRSNVKNLSRPNRFVLSFQSPPGIKFTFTENMQYHVRTASIPGRGLGDITNLYWQGLNYKIAGDPVFDDITVSFLLNENFELKTLFEVWMDSIANTIDNIRLGPNDYKGILTLSQLSAIDNRVIGTYFLHGVYPKALEPVELSQETIDAVEEFSVNLSIDFWSNSADPTSGKSQVLTS